MSGEEGQNSPTVRRIVGPTILLHSGTYFDFLDPESADFLIEDIAHGLSNICRFAGHSRFFYSVAQHSVYVSEIVPPEMAMIGLMHDAAEAFIGDMAKPLKDLCPDYRQIENRVERALFAKHGLRLPMPVEVKEADVTMLATEQLALMSNRDDWDYCRGRAPIDMDIPFMEALNARLFFMERYHELASTPGPRHG